MGAINIFFNQKGAVLAHVIIGREGFFRGGLRKAGDAILEDPAVVLADLQLLARTIRRLKVLAYSQRAIGINAPRKLNPELIFFPDLAQSSLTVRFISGIEFPALLLG